MTDGDHEGGVAGDQRSRLLQDAPRPPSGSTETPERAFSAAEPAQHHHPKYTVTVAKTKKPVQVLEQSVLSQNGSCEAPWPYLSVPETSQTRVTTQAFNHESKYGPYCELFFCHMKLEPEPHVRSESLFFHVPFRPAGKRR